MHFHFRYLKRLRVYPLHDRNRKPDMMWNGKGNLSRIARNSKINIKHIFFSCNKYGWLRPIQVVLILLTLNFKHRKNDKSPHGIIRENCIDYL